MDWIFYTTNREGEVDLNVTREPPSFTNTAANGTKRCTGDSSVDGIGELPRNLCQTETSVQNCIQTVPPIDN